MAEEKQINTVTQVSVVDTVLSIYTQYVAVVPSLEFFITEVVSMINTVSFAEGELGYSINDIPNTSFNLSTTGELIAIAPDTDVYSTDAVGCMISETSIEAPVLTSEARTEEGTVLISWTEVTGAVDYRLDVSTDAQFNVFVQSELGAYQDISIGNGESGYTYMVFNLFDSPYYYMRVRAVSTEETSFDSNILSLSDGVPVAPILDPVSSVTSVSFFSSWQSVGNTDGYILQASTSPTFDTTEWTDDQGLNTTIWQYTGVTAGTTYYLRVCAYNYVGQGPWSNIVPVIMLAASSFTLTTEVVGEFKFYLSSTVTCLVNITRSDTAVTSIAFVSDWPNIYTFNFATSGTKTITIDGCNVLNQIYLTQFSIITAIDVDANLPELTYLNIIGGSVLGTITIHPEWTKLRQLGLSRCNLPSCDIPAECTSIAEIYLGYNNLTTFTTYATWTALRYFYIYNNDLTTITLHAEWTNLEVLHVSHNPLLTSLVAFPTWTKLLAVYLHMTDLTTFTTYPEWTNLSQFMIGDTVYTPRAEWINLTYFSVFHSSVSSIAILPTWTKLEQIDITACLNITALTIPSTFIKLRYIGISNCSNLLSFTTYSTWTMLATIYIGYSKFPSFLIYTTWTMLKTFWNNDGAITDAANINDILQKCDAIGIGTAGSVKLAGGTNAAPTGAGITAKNNMITRGATVETN